MNDPQAVTREEVVAALGRIGAASYDEAFVTRCIELNTQTRRTIAMLPPPPDKSIEPSHVFSPPMSPKT